MQGGETLGLSRGGINFAVAKNGGGNCASNPHRCQRITIASTYPNLGTCELTPDQFPRVTVSSVTPNQQAQQQQVAGAAVTSTAQRPLRQL
jgi:hypothetical protein